MECRHQWCALATRCDIPGAEVGDHIDASQLSQQRRIVDLQCVARPVKFSGAVAHRLPVRSDGRYLARRHARLLQHTRGDLGVDASQRIGRKGSTVQFIWTRHVELQQLLHQIGSEGAMCMCQDVHGQGEIGVAQTHQHSVDAIQRRTGHQPDEDPTHGLDLQMQRPAFAGRHRSK